MIFVLALVCRVGIFKYTTANRNLGYELHLDRLEAYERLGKEACERLGKDEITPRVEELRSMGWEEALRAWRVFQAAVFAQLYFVPQDRSRLLLWRLVPEAFDWRLYKERPERRTECTPGSSNHSKPLLDVPYAWWDQKKLTEDGDGVAHYHTGNYLRDMISALNAMQWTLYSLLWWPLWSFPRHGLDLLAGGGYLFLVLVFGLLIFLRQLRIRRRRVILEDGLVSIHSCAITWAAVAIAHVAAAKDKRRPYFHYTERLAAFARHIEVDRLPILVNLYLVEGKFPFESEEISANQP